MLGVGGILAEAVADEIGAARTGIRLSPYITQRNMADDEIIEENLGQEFRKKLSV